MGKSKEIMAGIAANKAPIMIPKTRYGRMLKGQAHEALRLKIKGYKHILQLTKIASKLQKEYSDLSVTEIAALKSSADIQFKLLNKVLPDLKESEKNVNVNIETGNVKEMTTDQLKEIVYSVPKEEVIKSVDAVSESC